MNKIIMATSVIDYIFRELAVNYLDRNDLAHVEPEEITSKASAGIVKKLIEEVQPDFVDEEVVSERLIELDKATDSRPTTCIHKIDYDG